MTRRQLAFIERPRTRVPLIRIPAALLTAAALLSACGAAAGDTALASPASATTAPASASADATPSTAPAAAQTAAPATGAIRWTITQSSSKATVRVREQLAIFPAPSDAVLTATASGAFVLLADGTFDASSKITVDLTRLTSDSSQRDGFVKMSTLQTSTYPTATFVPTKVSGLTLPLPTSGGFTFTVTGKMTIHGTTKEVTFDVTAKREGTTLTATATAVPTWKFADFGMTAPRAPAVLSVVDEIKLELAIVATETN
ncbi:MAG TPA: YceI family protein [Candidatus Limnocylindria bacterium]